MKHPDFNAGRFGRYFVYDMRWGWTRAGLSTLILGIVPVVFFLCQLFLYFIDIARGDIYTPSNGILAVVPFIFTLVIPVKLYGFLTDKGQGSQWLMIPASSSEKYVSLMLNLLIVFPLMFSLLFGGCDIILSSVFPSVYGGSVLERLDDSVFWNDEPGEAYISIYINSFALIIMCLGAMIFKKAKVGKSILSFFGILILLLFLVALAGKFCSLFFDIPELRISSDEIHRVAAFRWMGFALSLIFIAIPAWGIQWRLRHLKH